MANRRITPLLPPTAPGRPAGPTRLRTSLRAALPLLLALTPLSAASLKQPAAGPSPQIQLQPGAAQPPPSELPKIVAQLAAQPALSAADCEKLARETVTDGQSVRQSGQPVKPGIVQDGLAAVDRGEALDAKAANWPELRSQLQDLLKPPPQQDRKQDDQKKDEKKEDQQQQQQQEQKQNEQSQDQKQQEQQKQEQKSEEQKQQEQQQQQSQQQPEPPQDKETQKIGGEKQEDKERQEHPELAVPLQKLDQVRDKDSPAELFNLLNEGEPKSPDQPKKDW